MGNAAKKKKKRRKKSEEPSLVSHDSSSTAFTAAVNDSEKSSIVAKVVNPASLVNSAVLGADGVPDVEKKKKKKKKTGAEGAPVVSAQENDVAPDIEASNSNINVLPPFVEASAVMPVPAVSGGTTELKKEKKKKKKKETGAEGKPVVSAQGNDVAPDIKASNSNINVLPPAVEASAVMPVPAESEGTTELKKKKKKETGAEGAPVVSAQGNDVVPDID